MFEHQLGLALGKSLAEVRALPFEEFTAWKTFYKLEPWGWHDREIRTASILTKLHNMHVSKRSDVKSPKDFYTDRLKAMEEAYSERDLQATLRARLLEANIEERRQLIGQAWGTIAKEVKLGDGSNDSS